MKKQTFNLLLACLSMPIITLSQSEPIIVAESTLKVAAFAEEIFYYGFAEGDQLLFDFEEVKGKEIKEIEIIELPSNSRFMDYKTKRIESKVITIPKTGIYKFRFANNALGGRICRFKIQRKPVNDNLKNFNTAVYWKQVFDTSYTPIPEKYLVSSDTMAVTVLDQVPKVSSQTALNGNPNKNVIDFMLPEGTICWSYFIGVGNEGKEAYKEGEAKFLKTAAASVSKIPGYGTLALLALYGLSYFSSTQGRDNIKYQFITDWDNVNLFMNNQAYLQYKQGNVITDAYQMKSPLSGKVYLGLLNDNIREAVEVTVKVTAVTVKQVWDTRTVQKMSVVARSEAYLKN